MSYESRGPAGLIALWKRWYRGDGELTDDSAMFAAALAALNLMGATLSVLWLLLAHDEQANEVVIVCATLAAYALGTFLVVGRRAKPWWMFQLSIALDTLVISVALVATGDPGSVYAFYYLWATLYAVCFFDARQVALQAVWVCTAYATSLALIGERSVGALAAQWLLPMVTLLAAGTLVRVLTGRLRLTEATLRHDAGHDPLTGLPNRARFGERLEELLATPGDPIAVVFIDLDHFKRVNDSLGHAVGDALLVEVASRLDDHAAPTTSLARFGGDEFLALIRTVEWEADARRLLDAFERPVRVGGYEFAVTASLGVAAARPGEDGQTVIANADAAVYSAKHEGRAGAAIFDDSMRAAVTDRLRLENDLRGALERDELRVAYQPIVALDDGAIVGAEALARWTHPTLGPIAPDVFIAVAEETGLIHTLGERVLTTACRDAMRWVADDPDFRISVNLSPRQLTAADFMLRLERALAGSEFPHRQLQLEVTETSVLTHDARTRENLQAIGEAGIGLALDDFGTGHSSLAQLRSVNFDVIKLDRGFIAADRTPTGDAILAAVASIGTATGARVLAEGIETAEHRERVLRLGCGFGQGWNFGRPSAAEEFDRLLRAHPASSSNPSATARATASSRDRTPSLR
jgi:diguanylate cyclase (GGDEF)-like protein